MRRLREAGIVSELPEALSALVGQRIPGGCDDCDAYQTMRRDGSVFLLTVHHDDTCPWLRTREQRR